MIRAVALLLALAGVARAQQPVAACEEPNVLIVLDRSGSMLEGRKWEQATEAITQVVRTFEHVIRFGLMVFPWQGPCFVERSQAVRVAPAPLNGPAVRQALPGLRPERDGATPLGTALDEASGYLIGQSLDGRRGFIVILTDGMETCDGNPVRAAEGAFTIDGFPVFVVGFGGGVDRGTLNRMAQVGGTGQAYQANDGRQLFEVFQAIVDAATAEVCDGVDNDCDGRVDEGIAPEPCETPCGSGERLCVDGGLSECRGGDIPAEVCDAVDNDCDAAIDEVQAYPCTTVSGNPGTVACVEGVLSGDCAPDDPSREEICDAVDNDQDGAVDEGTTQPCADGCHMGRRLCVDGSLTRCSALPAGDERCNGADDDCDGVVDEAAPCPEGGVCGHEGQCLRPCLSGECPDHFACAPDGFCHPRLCDPFCAPDLVCVRETCLRPCTLDAECGDAEVCQGRLCLPADEVEDPFRVPPPVIVPDAGPAPDAAMEQPVMQDDAGCGCRADGGAPGWWPGLALLALGRRRWRRR
ncbi:MAG: VWA domain-containing protein [Myxococcales bacterium]|nr:VWA domain-containing protein [Myxococcales bacterium]